MTKKNLVYVSDVDRRRWGGGPYAVNWHAVDQLQRRFNVTYEGLLTDHPLWVGATVAGVRRDVANGSDRFRLFSPESLDRNAALVSSRLTRAECVMFRSATHWCRTRLPVKYFVYLDVVFHTFFHNTFKLSDFDEGDLQRVWKEEAGFLENASGVFFDSGWGLEAARRAYGLRGSHYSAPGRGGVIDPPQTDTWNGRSRKLISIAFDFKQKGGDIILAAYKRLKPTYPDLTWHIVGGPPQDNWESVEGISYEGELIPDIAEHRLRLRELLADAFLIVHPTREDTSPLVLTEAASFGCPAVSVSAFAIPELVEHGRTGLLVEQPATPESVAQAIADLLDDPERYRAMRKRAREGAILKHSWDRIGTTMCDQMDAALGE